MNNTVPIARAMLLIFIVSVIGACSSTKSLFSKYSQIIKWMIIKMEKQ